MSNAIVWFRQDLRLADNKAFSAAMNSHSALLPLYILDSGIGGAQQWWLHHSLAALNAALVKIELSLCLRRGDALSILHILIQEHEISTVYWNRCYEPEAIARDTKIKACLQQLGVQVVSFNGSLLFEPWQVTTQSGQFFKVFTPYWRSCLRQIQVKAEVVVTNYPQIINAVSDALASWRLLPSNWTTDLGKYWRPGENDAMQKLKFFIENHIKGYNTARDIPHLDATSKLSPYLHFGEISPGQIWRQLALAEECYTPGGARFLAELGWREFSYHLLYHCQNLATANFKPMFDAFPWQNDAKLLQLWQQGKTGYPIVDAGMRELWHTGYMHNRVRMVVASFLTKDLFIDWRLGAQWFADTLVDADLANNSASWQWVAGCGADAAPYFRIFNPVLQGEKFDPIGAYVKHWIPELKTVPTAFIHKPWLFGIIDYPAPIVDHAARRLAALNYYKNLK